MHIRFWGTRGSLAKAGPATLRYGGNTSCVEVGMADGTLIVFDCGTGAHGMGQALLASGKRPIDGHLAQLVDQHSQLTVLAPAEEITKQRGLSGSEEATHDRDRNRSAHGVALLTASLPHDVAPS